MWLSLAHQHAPGVVGLNAEDGVPEEQHHLPPNEVLLSPQRRHRFAAFFHSSQLRMIVTYYERCDIAVVRGVI